MPMLLRATSTGKFTRFSATVAFLKVSLRLNCQSQGKDCPEQAACAGKGQPTMPRIVRARTASAHRERRDRCKNQCGVTVCLIGFLPSPLIGSPGDAGGVPATEQSSSHK